MISVSGLFAENRFDCDKILNENISETTFWFDTKWGPSPAKDFVYEINVGYPDLDVELLYFSVESAFWGKYSSENDEFFEIDDDGKLVPEFFAFGVKEGFLIQDSNGKYDFTRETPTPRLLL